MMDIVIREATLADQEGLFLLYAEIDALHHEAMPDTFRTTEEIARPSNFLVERLADEKIHLYVAEAADRLAGMILLKPKTQKHPLFYTQDYLHISTLIVAADFQGQGVAQLLLNTAVTFAKERELTQINLNVYEFNQRAIAFYEKEGFNTGKREMWLNLEEI
ncbi:MAG: GNAT family N-acetyltransferase [Chloroflexi bacterium]|nr:GNAT family N-acetyltransferase [Chloroflexota bacterium]